MFKILKADADTYITNRIIKGTRAYSANVGQASSIDLYKLYGSTPAPSGTVYTELSRALIHFDLTPLADLNNSGKIDTTHGSFYARLKLFDVYGGQPTPSKFTLMVNAMSSTWEEGFGSDIVYCSDYDAANFLTCSGPSTPWVLSGCAGSGSIGSSCDYYTGSLQSTQYFATGEEDLEVDVTSAVAAALLGTIPNAGFRISYSTAEEANLYTYFVKRFASRHAYDETKHPRLIVGFDDSVRDTSQGMTFDSRETLFLFNYDHGAPANLVSGSSTITGSNCIALKLQLPVSGGFYELFFTGSQHYAGVNPVVGTYSASVYITSSLSGIKSALLASGSTLKFKPIWGSLDGKLAYVTGSTISVGPPVRGATNLVPKKFVVTTLGLNDVHRSDETPIVRVNVFDYTTPLMKVVRLPVESPGALQGTVTDAFYSVRDCVTQKVVVPFDTVHGSTRLSNDASSLYFKLDMSNLTPERTYVIDVLLLVGGEQQRYLAASPVFKVSDLQ